MNNPRSSLAFLVLATFALVALITAPAASAKTAPAPKAPQIPDSEIVQLPQYTVTDVRVLPPPESWNYAALPGYEILSNASNRTTTRFLKDFQQLQVAMSVVWPALINAKPAVPTLIILCAKGNSFSQFIPDIPDPDIYITPTSLFVEDKERGAIVIDFMIQDSLANDGGYITSDPYTQFYRQYTRFLMRRANHNKPLPAWLEEGISRIFMTLDFTSRYVEFGKVDDGFGGSGIDTGYDYSPFTGINRNFGFSNSARYDDPFRQNRDSGFYSDASGNNSMFPTGSYQTPVRRFGYIMPLADMFSPDRAKMTSGNWSGQCYAFVHMCLYGLNKKYQKAFLLFATRALAGPVNEDDFKQCFGRTYKQMAVELRGYIDYTSYQSILFQAKRGQPGLPDPTPVEPREATQAEIGRIKGETLRLAGHPDESREAFIVPYLRHERDPGLLASLGLLESLEKHPDRARKFLEVAAKMDVVRPRAYVELARLRLDDALAKPAAPGGKLDTAQTASVLAPLFTARSQPPAMEDVYSLIGYTWLHSAARPAPSNLAVLAEGAMRFPRNTAIVRQAAELYTTYGPPETASALIKLGLRISRTTDEKARYETLRASLPAAK